MVILECQDPRPTLAQNRQPPAESKAKIIKASLDLDKTIRLVLHSAKSGPNVISSMEHVQLALPASGGGYISSRNVDYATNLLDMATNNAYWFSFSFLLLKIYYPTSTSPINLEHTRLTADPSSFGLFLLFALFNYFYSRVLLSSYASLPMLRKFGRYCF